VLVETGSVLLLTLFASLTYIGTLIAPMFGVVGDRIGHRDLLAMMRATNAMLAGMTLAPPSPSEKTLQLCKFLACSTADAPPVNAGAVANLFPKQSSD
jgi:MFS family permease